MSILYAKHRPPIGGVLTNKPIIIMSFIKIKLPTVEVNKETYDKYCKALMRSHGFNKREARAYMVEAMASYAEQHPLSAIEQLDYYGHLPY
tara:strand:+ start:112 stop:384 length:273 start_codon:yes stop_codon:yes gene_type:complete